MTTNRNEEYAKLFDCGDGVPALNLTTGKTNQATLTDEDFAVTKPATNNTPKALPAQKDREALLPIRTAAILATIVAQVTIGLGVVLGANPLIAGFAALAMMATGVGLAFADLVTKQY